MLPMIALNRQIATDMLQVAPREPSAYDLCFHNHEIK